MTMKFGLSKYVTPRHTKLKATYNTFVQDIINITMRVQLKTKWV